MAVIKEYADGTTLTKSTGRIDDWMISVNGKAPFDRDYFNELSQLANKYSAEQVYTDFMTLYNRVSENVEDDVFNELIPSITNKYNNDSLQVEKLFGTLYLVMLAEQNRFFGSTKTKLGKQVKGLAAHQILLEGYSVEEACEFSKGKYWRELAELCKERDINR